MVIAGSRLNFLSTRACDSGMYAKPLEQQSGNRKRNRCQKQIVGVHYFNPTFPYKMFVIND